MLYFWESNLYSRFLIFVFWYLLSILYLYESNIQYPFSLRDVITGLIALSPFDSPFSPPGHLYLPPPSSLLYVTHLTTSSTLCRMPHLNKKTKQKYQPSHQRTGLPSHSALPIREKTNKQTNKTNKQTKNSTQISPYIKILRKVQSSKTEPGRNRNYDQPNYKHWNWSCDQKSPSKQNPRTRWLHKRILSNI